MADKRTTVGMGDGARLKTDVYHPDGSGPWGAILFRTPYGSGGETQLAEYFRDSGFAAVVQQVRGTGDSDGQFAPIEQARSNALDAVDWLVSRPWYDETEGVGVFGMS